MEIKAKANGRHFAFIERKGNLMPKLITFISLAILLSVSSAFAEDCTFNTIPLHGKVKVVNHFADIKVQVVDHFADLKVKKVSQFADDCGEWQFVDHFPDFTIQYVDHFADIKIKFVDHFPGE